MAVDSGKAGTAGAGSQGSDLTVQGRGGGATMFVNVARGKKWASQLKWSYLAGEGDPILAEPALTSDNSAVIAGMKFDAESEAAIEKAGGKMDARRLYTGLLDCSIQPKKNWAMAVATADFCRFGVVSIPQFVEPGLLEEQTIPFAFRPFEVTDAAEVKDTPAAYIFLLT